MSKPRVLVFASGSAEGGGSGFEKLVEASHGGPLDAEIVAVVSNQVNGGVRRRADKFGIPFVHFSGPWNADGYQRIAKDSGAEFFALSGWLKRVMGLDSARTFNIHPGPLPEFGGDGMYGHHVHEAVVDAFHRGEVTQSAVSMHFVIPAYDRGPTFFHFGVPILEDDTPDSLGTRVNKWEHHWQPQITNLVVHREIRWDGVDPTSLQYPQGYEIRRQE